MAAAVTVLLFHGDQLQAVVSPLPNPQVAAYSLALPTGASMQVEFGATTGYGLSTWTQSAPQAGGIVSILVAGMRGFTTYHLRANVVLPDGTKLSDIDHTFTTGGLRTTRMPKVSVSNPGGPPVRESNFSIWSEMFPRMAP